MPTPRKNRRPTPRVRRCPGYRPDLPAHYFTLMGGVAGTPAVYCIRCRVLTAIETRFQREGENPEKILIAAYRASDVRAVREMPKKGGRK